MSVDMACLGDVGEFIRGITYKPSDVLTGAEASAIPCLRTKNIQEFLEDDDLVYVPRELVQSEKIVRAGDILVSSANSWNLVAKCCWVPKLSYQATFGGFTSILRAKGPRIDARYLYRWFSSSRVQAMARSFGQQTTNISNLNHKRCLDLEIPLPPLDEQKRIAAILDKADQLRQKRRQAIALLDSLTQSIFLEMFGNPASNSRKFPLVPLSDLINPKDRLNYGVVQPGDGLENGVPLIRISDLKNGAVDRSALKHIDPRISNKHSKSVLNGHEILISCVGSIGEIALASNADRGSNVARAVARVPLREDVSREFVAAYLRTDAVQNYFTKELRTVSQPTLNIKQISETLIPLVNPEEAQRFEEKLRLHRKLKKTQNLQLAETEAMFHSIQHRAFSGQL
ncbi:restriction endonuclease subunit S [Rhizobium ruizarguesonis]|uniref:restriction endonuclease subunit S n=1 Tax=Rhizobium ruizarguesonis TaxID=2081791 RepID=UPI0013D7D709|nr:restriction endonuclease subunit S [Rhizobium ruizarguesonis]NEH82036.1 restriction endonuclease subunit S [Rhizobium ruizarguesonis]NEI82126.1 restriction endonuclease subunit S [Rhizobium ruizarguesonis]